MNLTPSLLYNYGIKSTHEGLRRVFVNKCTNEYASDLEDLHSQITELERENKELSKKIQVNESLYFHVLDALPINIFLENPEGHTIFANQQACEVNARSLEELQGKTVFDFFPPAIAQMNREHDLGIWKQRQLITKEILAVFNGKQYHMFTGKTIIHIDESGEDFLLGFGLDITDRVRTEEMLRESEEKFRSVIEQAADSIFLIDIDGRILELNPAACKILKYIKEELLHIHIDRIFVNLPNALTLLNEKESDIANFEDFMIEKENNQIPVDVNIRLITIGKKQMYLAICRDIRDKKRTEAQIRHMAYHDALTNLPNRWYIQDYLQEYLTSSEKNIYELGFILLDLDRFKMINDRLGHDAGDLLLQQVSKRLQLITEKRETFLARFGGDEFILLIPQLTSQEEVLTICEMIIEVMRAPFEILGQKFNVSASIGVSLYPKDGKDLNTLIKNADLAMYDSKEKGRNGYSLYTENLKYLAKERMDLEVHLSEALLKNELFLQYQPKVCMRTGEIYGVEALIRWRTQINEILYPDSFIQIAEETGLIIPIGEWIIREACRQCKEWHNAGFEYLSISVNLSPRQFQNHQLESSIILALQETGLPPNALELEITEGMVMEHPEKAVETIKNLKNIGIKISIDDFGTGFSSLSYLSLFPIDTLKIDKSFIMKLERDKANAAIAAAVISLAHSLDLQVVAEGIESDQQYQYLLNRLCDFGQGFFISKPQGKEEISKLLKSYCPV